MICFPGLWGWPFVCLLLLSEQTDSVDRERQELIQKKLSGESVSLVTHAVSSWQTRMYVYAYALLILKDKDSDVTRDWLAANQIANSKCSSRTALLRPVQDCDEYGCQIHAKRGRLAISSLRVRVSRSPGLISKWTCLTRSNLFTHAKFGQLFAFRKLWVHFDRSARSMRWLYWFFYIECMCRLPLDQCRLCGHLSCAEFFFAISFSVQKLQWDDCRLLRYQCGLCG